MSVIQSSVGFRGKVSPKKISNVSDPGLDWQLKQALRGERIHGLVGAKFAKLLSKTFGMPTMIAELSAVKIAADGSRINYGVVSRKVVTTAFVEFMVDQLQAETTVWGDFKFHDSGVGVTAPVIGDTDIETTDGEARVTGTQAEGASANIYQSVGTITYTTVKAITEHGLFSIVTGGTLMDRSTFTAINVVATDQIEFTYELTCTAGG